VIFAARGLLVSLAFFGIVYCSLSSLVALAWWSRTRMGRKLAMRSANFLFGLRVFSFMSSAIVAVFFTFPSFWLMEGASLDEDFGTFILAGCSLLIFGAGLFRVIRAQARTTRAVERWSIPSKVRNPSLSASSLDGSSGAPALLLVGIRKPRVMISDMAATVLSDDELKLAIRHELWHLRSWDNAKKALINATPFPGMRRLENTWREAIELAADDAAVANRQDALDLAAALIKLSRSAKQWSEPALASGLVSGSSAIRLRVERLLKWRVNGHPRQRIWPWTLLVVFTFIIGVVSNYGATLVLTHRLTELLVP
jgi:hypothetical protein